MGTRLFIRYGQRKVTAPMGASEDQIDIDLSAPAVYDQWLRFDEFPRFMEGVEAVRKIDDTHLRWTVKAAGGTREWDAQITEQLPGRLIAWCSTDGTKNSGVVAFEQLRANKTRVTLLIECDSGFVKDSGFVEEVGNASHFPEGRAASDLERFRDFMQGLQRDVSESISP
jgi:uncharacterized membrane protein